MANPSFPSDGQNERIDALVDASGAVYLKYGVGTKTVTGAVNPAAWHGVATHVEAATSGATDGLVVIGGKTAAGAATVKSLLVDSSGRPIVVGAAASGSAFSGNPVLVGGSDGTNAQNLAVDTSGRAKVTGGAASGAAVSGNPVLVAGSDGTNARSLLADTLGNLITSGDYLTTYKTVTTQASGDTAVWTPTSGKKFRLKQFMIEITNEATAGSATDLALALRDATTAIGLTFSAYIPTSGATTAGVCFNTGWIKLGFGYLSSAANNVLNINLSSALSAGVVRVTAAGTEE